MVLVWLFAFFAGPQLYFAVKLLFAEDLNERLLREWRKRNAYLRQRSGLPPTDDGLANLPPTPPLPYLGKDADETPKNIPMP